MKIAGKSERPRPRRRVARARHRGLSLIEVLTASVVLAVGASGLGILQATALRDSREALQRTEAVVLAADMLDRIRANPAGSYRSGFGDGPAAAFACVVRDCGPDELASFDLATWKCRLGAWTAAPACGALRDGGALLVAGQQGLPVGDGAVSIDANGQVQVTVAWQVKPGLRREIAVASRVR